MLLLCVGLYVYKSYTDGVSCCVCVRSAFLCLLGAEDGLAHAIMCTTRLSHSGGAAQHSTAPPVGVFVPHASPGAGECKTGCVALTHQRCSVL